MLTRRGFLTAISPPMALAFQAKPKPKPKAADAAAVVKEIPLAQIPDEATGLIELRAGVNASREPVELKIVIDGVRAARVALVK